MSKFCLFHAALSLLLLPAAVMPAHNREDRQTFSVQTFKTPARDYGPMTWWHWINGHITREGIRKDLSAMHDAGLRGVQVFNTHMYLPKGPVKFGSEEWHGMISYALHVCDSLGMKFCITPGAGWSGSGGPWITAEQSMKKLTLSETFVSGGKTDTVLAMPETKGGYYREIAVQAVPAGIQAGTVEDLQAKIMAASKTAVRYDYSDDSSRAVRCDEIIDLTGSVDRDGRLECVLPDGDWCILRFGYTITGKKTHPAAWGGEGYEVDKLDSTDVLVQYEHYLKPLFEKNSRYLGNTFEGILFDSYEAGFQNWTERLPEEFTKMHGYDLLDYMPVFSGRPVESMKVTEQVLYDFRELLDHMLSEFYYGTLKKKINAAGLAVYAEPQGGPVPSMAMDFTDIPMNEFGYEDQYTMNATDSHGGDYGFASNPYYGMYGLHDFWDWAAIRSINSFIDVVNNAVERGVIDTEARDRYVAEARFVRAYCYFVMVRSYGGVPIITEVLDKYYDGAGNEQLFAFAERATEKETWDFVLSELDAAAAALGESPASEFRASRYSALGLKARAALYAASVSKYWDNQGAIDSKYKAVASRKTYMEESYASEYYRQCIKACEDIIISGRFSLYGANPGSVEEAVQNLGDMFRTKQDCEYLFGRSLNDGVTSSGSNYDVYNSPAQTVSGNNSCGKYSVTIDFVDKFDYYTEDFGATDGTVRTRNDGREDEYFSGTPSRFPDEWKNIDYIRYDNVSEPFLDKDARFQAWILYPDCFFRGQTIKLQGGLIHTDGTVNMWVDGSETVGDVT